MAHWVNIVETNCSDPSREKEFNDWYDNIHMPDVLASPGFLASQRYVSKEPVKGRGKYLTVYDLETDDIEKTMAERRERREVERAQGHYIDFVESVREVQYKLLGTFKKR